MQSIWFAGEFFSTHVHDTPSRPDLFLSARSEFIERGEVLKQIFSGVGPKKKCQHIFHYITTPPRSSHLNHSYEVIKATSINHDDCILCYLSYMQSRRGKEQRGWGDP